MYFIYIFNIFNFIRAPGAIVAAAYVERVPCGPALPMRGPLAPLPATANPPKKIYIFTHICINGTYFLIYQGYRAIVYVAYDGPAPTSLGQCMGGPASKYGEQPTAQPHQSPQAS